jgi:hypothetical protein
MNKRIEELAQCNERILNFFQTGPVQRAAIEEFAELIVRECMRMCEVAEVGLLTHGLKEQSYGAVGAKQHISNWFEVDK